MTYWENQYIDYIIISPIISKIGIWQIMIFGIKIMVCITILITDHKIDHQNYDAQKCR